MAVEVLIEDARWAALPLEGLAGQAAAATLGRLDIRHEADISLLATDDGSIARLNAEFRDRPRATNVLSWPAVDLSAGTPGTAPGLPEPDLTGEMFLGDIAMAFETCAREAEAGGKTLKDHATHLIVHAILHLLGYDHISESDAALMERLEVDILSELGVADPYSGGAPSAG